MILAASTSAVDKQIQLSPVISNQPLQCYVIFFFYNKYCKFFSLPISGSKLLSCRELLLYLLSLDLKWTKKVHRNFIWLYQTKRYEAQKFFHDMAKMHKNIFLIFLKSDFLVITWKYLWLMWIFPIFYKKYCDWHF